MILMQPKYMAQSRSLENKATKFHLPNVRALKKALETTKMNKQLEQVEKIIENAERMVSARKGRSAHS